MRRTFDSRRIRLACGGALSVLANVLPAHAFAQSTGATDTGDGTEIIVQARRVGESIQDVPASVSVLNADSIARLAIENVADYTRQTPGAILIGSGPEYLNDIALRGQGGGRLGFSESTTGIYRDGIYVAGGGFARLYGSFISWRDGRTPVPKEIVPQLAFDRLFRTYPFTVLEEDEGLLISGLCGRIWTLARDYPDLAGPESFGDWDRSGTVRVLFAHWIEPGEGDEFELVYEARVQPVDSRAERRLRVLWALVGPFEARAGAEALKAVVGRAEDGLHRSQDGHIRDRPSERPSR